MPKYNFIKTSDSSTAKKLQDAGFVLLSNDGTTYTFINNGNLSFDNKEKMRYTNNLCI